MASATETYQAIVGFVIILVVNTIISKIDAESAWNISKTTLRPIMAGKNFSLKSRKLAVYSV
jgi:hypothetical protein